MLEALAIGDLHFDKLDGLYPINHLKLQAAEINKAMRYALQNGIRYVFFLGDIGEHPTLSDAAKEVFFNLLHKYDGKLDIHIILGNHDVAMEDSHSLKLFHRLYETSKFQTVHIHAKPNQRVLGGVPVTFLPFPADNPSILGDSTISSPSINLAHIERPGAKRDNGYTIKKGGIEEPDTKDIWVIGHLHTPQKVGRSYYPGTLYQLNFGESLPKGFAHIRCKVKEESLAFRYRWIENEPAFKLLPLVIESKADLNKVSSNPLHLHKLYVRTTIPLPRSLLRQENIIDVLGYSDETELSHISGFNLGDQSDSLEFELTTGLEEFLTAKNSSVTFKQAERTLAKVLETKGNMYG